MTDFFGYMITTSFFPLSDWASLPVIICVRLFLHGLCPNLQCRLRRLSRSPESILGYAALFDHITLLGHSNPHLRVGFHPKVT